MIIDKLKDSIKDIYRWKSDKQEDGVIENPFNAHDMGGRSYLEVDKARFVRIYEGDYIIVFNDDSKIVCPSNTMQNILHKENEKYDRLPKNKVGTVERGLLEKLVRGRKNLPHQED